MSSEKKATTLLPSEGQQGSRGQTVGGLSGLHLDDPRMNGVDSSTVGQRGWVQEREPALLRY